MKTYEDGLNEAWEAARKIACDDSYGGYKDEELGDVFDTYSIDAILSTYTASEAIDKINKHEGFKVGDEVIDSIGKKSVVMRVSGTVITIMEGDGTAIRQEKEGFKKTGRHFPQIEEVLKQVQEGNE